MSFHLFYGEFNAHHDLENSNKVGGGIGNASFDIGGGITSSSSR
jgi:hypothetical protein